MPPTSSPVPRLSSLSSCPPRPLPSLPSVPSSVLRSRSLSLLMPDRPAIASRSPSHPVAPAPPPRHRVTSDQQQGSASAVCHPARPVLFLFLPLCHPARPRPLPLFQVVRGRAEHQPGRVIPCRSSCRPSPPCRGAVRIVPDESRQAGSGSTYQGGGRCRERLKVLGKNYKAVSL